MKKLYRKGAVHPTQPVVFDQLFSLLPAAILTLTAALSVEEKEVLAYLVSCSSASFCSDRRKKTASSTSAGGSRGEGGDHPPCFDCYCFRCYMSYWVKWDSSPNRQLIHEIIDAFEDSLLNKEKNKRERRKSKSVKRNGNLESDHGSKNSDPMLAKEGFDFIGKKLDLEHVSGGAGETGGGEEKNVEEEELEKGSVRRFMSFLGEGILSIWG